MKLIDYIKIYKFRFMFDWKMSLSAHKHAWFFHHSPLIRWLYGL